MNNQNEALENNAFNKIMKKIETIKTKDLFSGFIKMNKWCDTVYHFTCPEHGDYILDGRLIRELNLKKDFSCPNCNNPSNKNKNRIEKFEKINVNDRLTYMASLFNELDWNDLDKSSFQNIDHTIRPACPEHGEILTTSRKLLNGESCKWCDGIKEDIDNGDYYLEQSREKFLYEKLSFYKPELFNPDTKLIYQGRNTFFIQSENKKDRVQVNKLKGNLNYIEHLKEVRTPEVWNSIFFKLNLIDKSTKFRFSLVYYIELNETWIEWYKNKILEMDDQELAQKEATNALIGAWTNLVIGNLFDFEIQWSFWSNKKRIITNYNWYRIKNKEKEMLLPDSLLSKLKLNLSQYNIPCYWSEIKWDTTSTNIPMIRESLGKKTNICPICKNILTKPVIDHEHKKKVKGTGRIRDSICSNCNVFIAKVENNCKRYNINLEELPEVLKNISEYFTTQQYNMIHYTDKDSRPTLSKTLANKVIKYWEYLYPGKRKKLRYPKSGIITKDWEDALVALEKFENSQKVPFTKNDYKLLLRKIEIYNSVVNTKNISLPKTKKIKLLEIPEYPKLKLITSEIKNLIEILEIN